MCEEPVIRHPNYRDLFERRFVRLERLEKRLMIGVERIRLGWNRAFEVKTTEWTGLEEVEDRPVKVAMEVDSLETWKVDRESRGYVVELEPLVVLHDPEILQRLGGSFDNLDGVRNC